MSVVLTDESLKTAFVADFVETVVAVDTSGHMKTFRAVPGMRRLGRFDGIFVLETGQQYRRLRLLGLLCKGRHYIMNENMDWFELRDFPAAFRHFNWRMRGRLIPFSALYLIVKSLVAIRVLLHACYWYLRSIAIRFEGTQLRKQLDKT
jgi:hypothetical protein